MFYLSPAKLDSLLLTMVVGLLLCWWDVSYWFEESAVVEPVDVLKGGVLDLVPVAPWSLGSDEFDAPMIVKSVMGPVGGCGARSGIGWRAGGCGLGRVRVRRCGWGGFRAVGRPG